MPFDMAGMCMSDKICADKVCLSCIVKVGNMILGPRSNRGNFVGPSMIAAAQVDESTAKATVRISTDKVTSTNLPCCLGERFACHPHPHNASTSTFIIGRFHAAQVLGHLEDQKLVGEAQCTPFNAGALASKDELDGVAEVPACDASKYLFRFVVEIAAAESLLVRACCGGFLSAIACHVHALHFAHTDPHVCPSIRLVHSARCL